MMSGKGKKNGSMRHLIINIAGGLIVAFLLACVYLFVSPVSKFIVALVIAVVFGTFFIMLLFEPSRKKVAQMISYVGMFFWPPHEHKLRIAAETEAKNLKIQMEAGLKNLKTEIEKLNEEIKRLQKLIDQSPDLKLIERIGNPATQEKSLNKVIDQMDGMGDERLAKIVGGIRHYADDILKSVGDNGNRKLFRELAEKLSVYEVEGHRKTVSQFLWLLSDIFDMKPSGSFSRQVQKDMVGPLKHVIWRVDEGNLPVVKAIIEKIMADKENEHEMAFKIIETLQYLVWKTRGTVCRIIFEEGKKRAFAFPNNFGFDFLNILNQLEHRVIGLGIQTLRDILQESLRDNETGLVNSNKRAYQELCSTVFAPLEDPKYEGIRHCRVFRRLKGNDGKVEVECFVDETGKCNCKGESLSFRGFYSSDCQKKEGLRFKAAVIPIKEMNHRFDLDISVAKVHTDEEGREVSGRGIFFENAEESTAKELYEYISRH